jgi:hypothetical protein
MADFLPLVSPQGALRLSNIFSNKTLVVKVPVNLNAPVELW